MTSSPLVTVIIPTYNSSGTLRLTLETVLRQTFEDFEVWIIGDGCTDESRQAVASFGDSRFHWLNLPENSGGPSRPRNEGLKNAKGRYIAYLGHDDLWFPWHLDGLVGYIRQEECDLAYSLGAVIGPAGVVGSLGFPEGPKSQHGGLSPSNWLHTRSLIEAIGPWSLKLKFGDDQEFLGRLWAHKAGTGYHRELSLLKFPSGSWKMYSLTSHFPQSEYVDAMRRDAAALRQEILLDLATRLSRKDGGSRGRGRVTESLFRLVRSLLRRYGYDRWPLNHWIYRRYRRRAGLP